MDDFNGDVRNFLSEGLRQVFIEDRDNLWPKLEKRFKKASLELSRLPYIVAHRDFQSKNIMLTKKGPVIIDFQDSLMAPLV